MYLLGSEYRVYLFSGLTKSHAVVSEPNEYYTMGVQCGLVESLAKYIMCIQFALVVEWCTQYKCFIVFLPSLVFMYVCMFASVFLIYNNLCLTSPKDITGMDLSEYADLCFSSGLLLLI